MLQDDIWTINRKTESPNLSLTLTIPKIFPDFLKSSLTFPDLEKFLFFPDFSLTVATMINKKQQSQKN